jgi:hypothetical protein
MHHTNTQYSPASDTQHTVFSAFLSFLLFYVALCLTIVEPALRDPQKLHILQRASHNSEWKLLPIMGLL